MQYPEDSQATYIATIHIQLPFYHSAIDQQAFNTHKTWFASWAATSKWVRFLDSLCIACLKEIVSVQETNTSMMSEKQTLGDRLTCKTVWRIEPFTMLKSLNHMFLCGSNSLMLLLMLKDRSQTIAQRKYQFSEEVPLSILLLSELEFSCPDGFCL